MRFITDPTAAQNLFDATSRRLKARNGVTRHRKRDSRRRHVTIGALSDDVLLGIFDLHLHDGVSWEWEWLTLAHVCRRWRSVISASPYRLDLLLLCREKTPVKEMLGAWPTLPIKIYHNLDSTSPVECADNIFAALNHRDRLSHIELGVGGGLGPQWEKVAEATMQEPLPALTSLKLEWKDDTVPILPDSFLDGSAPRLEWLSLKRVPFPSLPKLFLSASDLVDVTLSEIPHTGYISPETMATCLSAMTRLKSISFGFHSPRSRPDPASRRPPPSTRIVLHTLTSFSFFGVSEYLEDLVARIDAPLLDNVYVTFLHQLIFDIPQLARFIGFSEELGTLDQVDLSFYDSSIEVILYPPERLDNPKRLGLKISCTGLEWQLSALAQVCDSPMPLLPTLESLQIRADKYPQSLWQDDMDNTQWLELLHPFTSVKDLYLFGGLALQIVHSLQGQATERVMDVLPALQNVVIVWPRPPRPVREVIRQFAAARERSGCPITVLCEERGRWVDGLGG